MDDSKAWEAWAPKVKVTGKTLPKVTEPAMTILKVCQGQKDVATKTFNSFKAKAYLLRLAADFIEDEVFRNETLEISMAALEPRAMDSDYFYWILESLLEWDTSTIAEAMDRVSD